MKKAFYIWIILNIWVQIGIHAADQVGITANAPDAVAVGDQFRLSFTINTQNVRDFRVGEIKDFDVLMGPSRSQQSSVQMINGKTTSTSSITFTYILMANKEGTFTIPGATAVADGKEVESVPLKVKVLPKDEANGIGGVSGNDGQSSGRNNATLSATDLFVTSTTSKTTVYEQEAILLTYKIYAAVDLRGFDNVKLPDFKGFQSQEVELPNDRHWELEHYRGRNYRSTIYRQFVLFPQQTGQLEIESARFDASVARATEAIDPFDAFFNRGNTYVEIKKTLTTPKILITVNPLPSGKPEGFTGGVGDFSISSSISSNHIKANDAVTLRLNINGVGNLKLIKAPEVKFPEDFEIYDPKVDNQFRLTSTGLSGSQTIEYLFIPRNAGTFKIPALKFSFFDTTTKSYKTLTTDSYELQVDKGDGTTTQTVSNFNNKEDLRILNEDIRFIKQNDVKLRPRDGYFFNSLGYWLFYIIPLAIFIVLFIIYRRQIAENANVIKMKNKKANKVALKRMKEAGKLLANSNSDQFYDEVLKALWGYTSDKLNIPSSLLSKDNIEGQLQDHQVPQEVIKEFIDILNTCEFARFAPGEEKNQNMDKVYTSALDTIGKMENTIKH